MQHRSKNDIFSTLPAELWALILSHFCITNRVATRLHRSLCFAGRSSYIVTNSERVWQARLAIAAVHLGFAHFLPSSSAETTSLLGIQRHPTVMVRPAESESNDEDHREHQENNNGTWKQKKSSKSILGSKICGKQDPCALAWNLQFSEEEELLRAPLAFRTGVSSFTSWKQRVLYVYMLLGRKCCVCNTANLLCRNENEARKGFEFCLPSDLRRGRFCCGEENQLRQRRTARKRLEIEERFAMPWHGLRICVVCASELKLTLVELPPPPPPQQFRKQQQFRKKAGTTIVTTTTTTTGRTRRRERDEERSDDVDRYEQEEEDQHDVLDDYNDIAKLYGPHTTLGAVARPNDWKSGTPTSSSSSVSSNSSKPIAVMTVAASIAGGSTTDALAVMVDEIRSLRRCDPFGLRGAAVAIIESSKRRGKGK